MAKLLGSEPYEMTTRDEVIVDYLRIIGLIRLTHGHPMAKEDDQI